MAADITHDTSATSDTSIFERRESNVRSYCRSFPTRFARAKNATLVDTQGNEYIDFLAGCSSLNYGHNDHDMQQALVDYITTDGVTHGLDMFTNAKARFIEAYEEIILKPRDMDHKLMFPGPTGANAVESAMKIARKVTGRKTIVSFTNGFHGMTLGALACTANSGKRAGAGAGAPLCGVERQPYDGYFGPDVDTADLIEKMLDDPSSGLDAPAAFLVEPVQGEGGLNAASGAWLKRIQDLAHKHGALFIVDDIQAGCGRTGTFFSTEPFGLQPDIITQAKSISGMGLPLALVLIRPHLDIWKPGEHNGTFRGNNHAFVTARVALEKYWADGQAFSDMIHAKAEHLTHRLQAIAGPHGLKVKGRGMMVGIDTGDGEAAGAICRACFDQGLIIETSGSFDEVVKVLCPLTIPYEQLDAGLDIIARAFAQVMGAQFQQAAE